jgi:tyrosine-protein phosphatase SIW14
MARWSFWLFSALLLIGVVVPLRLAVVSDLQTRNLDAVRTGVLYRSAQLPLSGLKRAIHDHGIRTIVNLRDGLDATDRAEEQYCRQWRIGFHRFTFPGLRTQGDVAHVSANLQQFVEIMADPQNHPVLVHCFAGTHRTGLFVALYRRELEAWNNEQIFAEMRANRYWQLDMHSDVRDFLSSYRRRGRYDLEGKPWIARLVENRPTAGAALLQLSR